MGKSKRPATKAFLRGLSKARAEPAAKKALTLPDAVRAFGVSLVRAGAVEGYYHGYKSGCHIELWQGGTGAWTGRVCIGTSVIQPHLSSASPMAAIRNLRGTLQNLHISIEKFLKKKEGTSWLKPLSKL